jgi:hypothetical protein
MEGKNVGVKTADEYSWDADRENTGKHLKQIDAQEVSNSIAVIFSLELCSVH